MTTIEQRLEQLELQNQRIERQSQRIERKNRRLIVALTVMAVAICAVVTMAATGEKDAEFDTVVAKHIFVVNDRGRNIVSISPNAHGYGVIWTKTAQGKDLVTLGATTGGHGSQSPNAIDSCTWEFSSLC